MRQEALQLLGEQIRAIQHEIEACQIEILDDQGDADAINALSHVLAKYEAVADQIEAEIKSLK